MVDRTFLAFLRLLWRHPGFKLTIASLVGFGSIVVMNKGLSNLLVTLAIAMPIAMILGFRNFRRTGRV